MFSIPDLQPIDHRVIVWQNITWNTIYLNENLGQIKIIWNIHNVKLFYSWKIIIK